MGDRNSKLSVDFREASGEDMVAAQVGGVQSVAAWGNKEDFIASWLICRALLGLCLSNIQGQENGAVEAI